MKLLAIGFLSSVAVASGCGGKTPAARAAQSADEAPSSDSNDSGDSNDDGAPAAGPKRGAGSGQAGDGPMKCGGFEVDDLISVLSRAQCEVPGANADARPRDVGDSLEITLKPDSARIAPGSRANVRLTLHNKGKVDLALDFVVDPEPRFDFELYTLKGTRVDRPAGEEPSLPDAAEGPAPEKKIARLVLAAQGTATAVLPFDAVKYKWASKEKAKGALPGHGYPREPAGPLPKGKYVLRLVTPLVGVFEGVDHEVSQPRTQILIGKF